MMEDVLEQLKILDYEQDFCEKKTVEPFARTYFAIPASNTGVQFKTFLDIVSWLMRLCHADFTVDKFDDPNTSVNKMMLSLKNMGFQMDFPASKLKQAHGECVCAVLMYLCEQSLDAKGFRWNHPEYDDEGYQDEAEVDETADAGSDIEDNLDGEEEEEEVLYTEMLHVAPETNGLDESQKAILESNLDPLLWQTELERVGPRLKVSAQGDTGKEWRGHIEQTRKHEMTITAELPDTKQQLTAIGSHVSEILEKVSTKEKYINSQFEHLRQEYHQIHEKLKEVTDTFQASSNNVNKLTNDLRSAAERLDEIKDTMDSRGNSMTDTSPLVQIKQALSTIRDEIKTFELRIGVVSHTLMQSKMRVKSARDEATSRNKNRDDDDDFDLSDDDDDGF
jgi:estrogen-related receptor beta like 1